MSDDFLIRIIEGMAEAVARLLGQQSAQQDEEATRQSARSFVQATGGLALCAMTTATLVGMLLPPGATETHQALLTADAMLDLAEQEPAHGSRLVEQAVHVVDAAVSVGSSETLDAVGPRAVRAAERHGLAPSLRARLVRICVATGQLALAEDLAWEGLDAGEPDAPGLAGALLDALDELPEARLRAGGLEPGDLAQARRELDRHATA